MQVPGVEVPIVGRPVELVAIVIGAEEAEEYLAWRRERRVPALADLIAELQRVSAEEGYALPEVDRADRQNPLLDGGVSARSRRTAPKGRGGRGRRG